MRHGFERVYNPSECDDRGVPLDWDRCRECDGTGKAQDEHGNQIANTCRTCWSHGSLKAAALDRRGYIAATSVISPYVMTIQDWRAGVTSITTSRRTAEFGPLPIRCEDCLHPMGEETWEGDLRPDTFGVVGPRHAKGGYLSFRNPPDEIGDEEWQQRHLEAARSWILRGQEPHETVATHYSPCDERCRHDGENVRWFVEGQGWVNGDIAEPTGDHLRRTNEDRAPWWKEDMKIEASWRQVDVRTMGWPHDLRLENLAVLCLRCYARRSNNTGGNR